MNLQKKHNYTDLISQLSGKAILDEPLSKYTTFRVGGNADLFVNIKNVEDLKFSISYCKKEKIPFCIIGWGSNLLVSDLGFPGVVLNLQTNMNHFTIDGNNVLAEAGASVPLIIQETLENNLTGMDFLYGIPGTFGGCIAMNAGSGQHGMEEIIAEVRVLNINTLSEKTFLPKDLKFSYRKSIFLQQKHIVLSGVIVLQPGKKQEELQKLRLAKEKRRNSQPLQFPNAGCIWKNPFGFTAGKLIEEANLKGFQIGGAEISSLHANFIINVKNSTAKDILNLMVHTEKIVQEKYGITLEREIQLLGRFPK